ncbi:MAG: hypothetical protein RIC80_01985 [Cyclobacteriaceae bacterium]
MSKIIFATKEENNSRREKEFLALSPSQRVMCFLNMLGQFNKFETRAKDESKDNFVIEKRKP